LFPENPYEIFYQMTQISSFSTIVSPLKFVGLAWVLTSLVLISMKYLLEIKLNGTKAKVFNIGDIRN
jgi:hypothetical protein